MVTDDEPDIVDDPVEVANPARHQESAGDGLAHDDDDPAGVAGPAHRQDPAVDGPAGVDEPVAHGTPAGNECQQSVFPFTAQSDQPDYFDWLHVNVDSNAASDRTGYGCSLCPGQACCTDNYSYAQRWWHPTQEVQDPT